MVYLYNGILSVNKKELSSNTCYMMNLENNLRSQSQKYMIQFR